MNLSKVEPLIAQLSAALDAHDFRMCVRHTKQLFLNGACVEWNCDNSFRLRWAEWQLGEPGSFRTGDTFQVAYRIWTKPSPAYRVGTHWIGGSCSGLTIEGSQRTVSVSKQEFARAKRVLEKLANGSFGRSAS